MPSQWSTMSGMKRKRTDCSGQDIQSGSNVPELGAPQEIAPDLEAQQETIPELEAQQETVPELEAQQETVFDLEAQQEAVGESLPQRAQEHDTELGGRPELPLPSEFPWDRLRGLPAFLRQINTVLDLVFESLLLQQSSFLRNGARIWMESQDEVALLKEKNIKCEEELGLLRRALIVEKENSTRIRTKLASEEERSSRLQGELAVQEGYSDSLQQSCKAFAEHIVCIQTHTQTLKSKFHEAEVKIEEQTGCFRTRIQALESELHEAEAKIEDQTGKTLCQICFERPRNALCLPCRHLSFCILCLERHLKTCKTCPTCRVPTERVLECYI